MIQLEKQRAHNQVAIIQAVSKIHDIAIGLETATTQSALFLLDPRSFTPPRLVM